jgi:hypothetical protein
MAIDATHAFLEAFGAGLIRYERKTLSVANVVVGCGSLHVRLMYMPEIDTVEAICQTCGLL